MVISRQISIVVFCGITTFGCPTGKSFPDFTEKVSINGGTFTMGLNPAKCEDGESPLCDPYASAAHQVALSPYFIDKHEVTNGQYRHCVHEKKCDPPRAENLDAYHKNADFFHHPVTNVTWNMAEQYCKWAGRRLPTEAEWEFAARSSGDMFPWGNALALVDSCGQFFLQGCPSTERPGAVASATGDVTSLGVNDLGGNVAEWVSDRFSETQYCQNTNSCEKSDPNCIYEPCDLGFSCLTKTSADQNPQGPKTGPTRVYRGGSFADDRCCGAGFIRRHVEPEYQSINLGFRCAKDWEQSKDLGITLDQGFTDTGISDMGTETPVLDQGTEIETDIVFDIKVDTAPDQQTIQDLPLDQTIDHQTIDHQTIDDQTLGDQTIDSPPQINTSILHFDGTTWSLMDSGTSIPMRDIWGSGPDDVFAVGAGGSILHYDGQKWSHMGSGTNKSLLGIWGLSSSEVFAVGENGATVQYDGTSWSDMGFPFGTPRLEAVWAHSQTDVWALATSMLYHHNGFKWSPHVPVSYNGMFFDIWGSGPSDVYAVGVSGRLIHFDGQTWSNKSSTYGFGTDLFVVGGTGPTNVFIGGQWGNVAQYDGQTWSQMNYNANGFLQSLWGIDLSNVFASGTDGSIVYFDGQKWSSMDSGTTRHLYGIWGNSPSNVFAVAN